MVDIAWAQVAQEPSLPGILATPLPAFVLVFVIFYFLLIRPQQKKAKDHREMLEKLKKNDEVMTSGGIYGKVVALSDKDNTVTLEVASNVRLKFSRSHISTMIKAEKGEKVPAKEVNEH